MPNWCNNSIEVSHEDPQKIARLVEAFKRGEFCDAVIPVPEDLKREGSSTHGGANADEYDRIRAENQEKHGYSNWYDFCTSNWSTKWDVGGSDCSIDVSDDGRSFNASFDSAWSPPTGVYDALVEQGYSVRAYYYEPGMCFAGVYADGEDDCYSDWGDSQGAKDMLPEELDEMFGISDSQAEWEEEERMDEDLYRWTKEGGETLKLEGQ